MLELPLSLGRMNCRDELRERFPTVELADEEEISELRLELEAMKTEVK